MLFSKKDLQKLIIPLMFEQLLAVSVGMVDTLMVSQAGEAGCVQWMYYSRRLAK